jgi:uncharacterized membrane protein
MLVILGAVLILVGVVVFVGGRLGLGHLPGDFSWHGKNTHVYVPLASGLIISVVLTVLLNLFLRR